MTDCKSFSTPAEPSLKLHKDDGGKGVDSTHFKQIVGSLIYLTYARPNIIYTVSLISRYMESPSEMHLHAARRILRYVKGSTDYGVFYKRDNNDSFVRYVDSIYAGDIDDRKCMSSSVFMFNSGTISWLSKKQQIVTFSTIEIELMAATPSSCQALWLRNMLQILGVE